MIGLTETGKQTGQTGLTIPMIGLPETSKQTGQTGLKTPMIGLTEKQTDRTGRIDNQ